MQRMAIGPHVPNDAQIWAYLNWCGICYLQQVGYLMHCGGDDMCVERKLGAINPLMEGGHLLLVRGGCYEWVKDNKPLRVPNFLRDLAKVKIHLIIGPQWPVCLRKRFKPICELSWEFYSTGTRGSGQIDALVVPDRITGSGWRQQCGTHLGALVGGKVGNVAFGLLEMLNCRSITDRSWNLRAWADCPACPDCGGMSVSSTGCSWIHGGV